MIRVTAFEYGNYKRPDDLEDENEVEQLLSQESRASERNGFCSKVPEPCAEELARELEGNFTDHVLPQVSVVEPEPPVEV